MGERYIWLMMVLFLALGLFFRAYDLGGRDLWTDEAWVALAATQPTAAGVLQEGKSTPPLYTLTVWSLAQAFGASETVLRLTSLLFGIGALVLFWPLCRALLPPAGALSAFALASLSPRLVYFSKELKQYSADVFFAVLVFWLAERQLGRQGQGGWLLFTLLLALGLGYSHPLVFVIPAAAPVLWWRLPQARKAIYGAFASLGLIFLGYYWLFFRGQVDPELLVYWQADFPDLTCGTDFLCWLGGGWSRFGRYFFWGGNAAILGVVFFGAGLASLVQTGRPRAVWYFFGPILACLAAAFAQRYPFMGQAGGVRLMMFSAPMLFLVTGAGLGAILTWLWPRISGTPAAGGQACTPHPDPLPSRGEGNNGRSARRWPGIIFLGVVIFWLQPVALWQENLHPQANREEIKPLIHYLQTHRRPEEPVYVYYFAIYPFKFYYQGPQENIIWGESCHERCLPLPPARLRQIQRLWLIFSHFETPADVDGFIDQLLGAGWTREFSLAQPGALLFRYTPASPPAALNSPKP